VIKDVLTWQDNATITYPSSSGTSKYEDDWQSLILTLEDYKADAFFCPFDVEFRHDALAGDEWKPLTEQGVKAYLGLKLATVRQHDRGVLYSISGKAKLSKGETITVAAVDGARRDAGVPADFRSTYEDIEISIVGSDKDERGFLRFHAASENFPESLSFHATMQNSRLKELVEMIAGCSSPPVLTAGLRAMLFCPSWRGAAPLDFPTEYLYPADLGFRIGMVSSLTVSVERHIEIDPVTKEPVDVRETAATEKLSDKATLKILHNISYGIWLAVGFLGALAIRQWV
jgi:hypothetical protein